MPGRIGWCLTLMTMLVLGLFMSLHAPDLHAADTATPQSAAVEYLLDSPATLERDIAVAVERSLDDVHPSWRHDKSLVSILDGMKASAIEKDKQPLMRREKTIVKSSDSNGKTYLSIRVLRRARGACSGGRCG